MLVIPAIAGLLTLFFGMVTIDSGLNRRSQEICSANVTMCPQCDQYCDYWKLSDSCFLSKAGLFLVQKSACPNIIM